MSATASSFLSLYTVTMLLLSTCLLKKLDDDDDDDECMHAFFTRGQNRQSTARSLELKN